MLLNKKWGSLSFQLSLGLYQLLREMFLSGDAPLFTGWSVNSSQFLATCFIWKSFLTIAVKQSGSGRKNWNNEPKDVSLNR